MPSHDELARGVRRLHGDFDALFGELLEGRSGRPRRAPADVYAIDDPAAIVIEVDAAGLDPEDVVIELEGRHLTVRGTRHRDPRQHRVYHHAEIDWGPFERRIELGVAVDGGTAAARYEAGVLVITLPLARTARQARVPITLRAAR